MKFSELDTCFQQYLKCKHSDNEHKLISVITTLRNTTNPHEIKQLEKMKQLLKRRISRSDKEKKEDGFF